MSKKMYVPLSRKECTPTLWRSIASVLPISMNVPKGARQRSVSCMKRPERQFRMRSQPRWCVACSTSDTKSHERLLNTKSAPSERTYSSFFLFDTVAITVAPAAWASWMAPEPTPPAAPWIRTTCPFFTFPSETMVAYAVV